MAARKDPEPATEPVEIDLSALNAEIAAAAIAAEQAAAAETAD